MTYFGIFCTGFYNRNRIVATFHRYASPGGGHGIIWAFLFQKLLPQLQNFIIFKKFGPFIERQPKLWVHVHTNKWFDTLFIFQIQLGVGQHIDYMVMVHGRSKSFPNHVYILKLITLVLFQNPLIILLSDLRSVSLLLDNDNIVLSEYLVWCVYINMGDKPV